MKFNKFVKNRKDILRIYSYFLVVCFLLIAFLVPSQYWYSAKTLETDAIEYNMNILTQLKKSVDVILNEVNKSLGQMVIDFSIANYMDYYRNKDYLMLNRINEKLTNYHALNSYIHSINIYYYNEDCVLTHRMGVKSLEAYEDKKFIMDIKDDVIPINAITKRKIYDHFSKKYEHVITIVKPIPLMYYVPTAYIIVNITEKYLSDTIDSINSKENIQILLGIDNHVIASNKAHVISGDGEILFQNLNSIFASEQGSGIYKIGGQRAVISHITSEKHRWKYVAVIPYKAILGKIIYLKNFSMIIACGVLLLFIFISLFFTGKLYKPLQSIALLFNNNTEDSKQEYGVYEYIKKNVDDMLEENRTLEEDLRQYKPVLKNNFLNGLLKGTIEDRNDIKKQLDYYDLNIGNMSNYVVFIISIDNYEKAFYDYSQRQKSTLSVYLIQVLNELLQKNYHSVICENVINEVSIIVNLPENLSMELLPEKCRELGRKIKKAVTANMKYTVTVGMGEIVEDIMDISASYYKALQAVQYAHVIGFDKLISFGQIKEVNRVDFRRMFKLEGELIHALKQGKTDTAINIFDLMIHQDGKNNEYVLYILIHLLSSMIKSIYEIGGNLQKIVGQQNVFEDLLKLESFPDIRTWFEKLFIKVVNFIEGKKHPGNSDIVALIKDYISNNYAAVISLDTISEMVFLSPSYISKIFKAEAGICLKEYVNSVRLDNAKKFLSCPDYTVNQIAGKIGYDKVQSFIKAFKKYVGMTPGEFRMTLIN